ncbi:MAG: nucleotide exchange factor GrpE [Actinomycetota bacterium]|nr:nucleotide exchange factor GrpE [Actinomycetota bacterium]
MSAHEPGPAEAEEFIEGADDESVEEGLEGDGDDAADADAFASDEVPDSADSADTNIDDELANVIDTEIHELAAERDQFKDIAQRLQADFENYRKRMSSQVSAEIDRATGKMAEALLPVLDAAEAAYVQHPDEIGPLLNLMLTELRKQGLEVIDLLDEPFDPNLADAVAHEPGDGGEPVVADVLRSGYSWNGRTLRPAMVRTRD